ncbi:MAG: hypothetical protein QF906_02565, partial [Dehalococcoidales bacterium]|nr:hypothetical protein [Dehalococcoidales bacterium]
LSWLMNRVLVRTIGVAVLMVTRGVADMAAVVTVVIEAATRVVAGGEDISQPSASISYRARSS